MTHIYSKSSMSFDDVMARSRELGFVRGIRLAQKFARAEGDHAFAFKLGMLIMQADTFVLANTKERSNADDKSEHKGNPDQGT